MLADDPLGASREAYADPLPDAYYAAFAAIDQDPNQELVVVEVDGQTVGILQLTYLPSLTYQGRWRAQIEGVRIAKQARSAGLGTQLFTWAIARARERGCRPSEYTAEPVVWAIEDSRLCNYLLRLGHHELAGRVPYSLKAAAFQGNTRYLLDAGMRDGLHPLRSGRHRPDGRFSACIPSVHSPRRSCGLTIA